MSVTSWIYLGLLFIGIVLLVCYHRAGRVLKCVFFTGATGLGALGLVWIASHFISVQIAITPLSLLISGMLGVPGVVGMLILQLI